MQDVVYLFPFEKIKQNSKILIYGAGRVGQSFWQQVQMTHYCQVVCIADRAYTQYPAMGVPLIHPDEIPTQQFDFLLVAIDSETRFHEIKKTLLIKYKVPERIIISGMGRSVQQYTCALLTEAKALGGPVGAYMDGTGYSMAIYLAGGLGDCIIAKKFILAMMKETCISFSVDLYGDIYNEECIHAFFDDCSFVHQIFVGRSLYFQECGNYDVALQVLTFVTMDVLKIGKLQVADPVFTEKLQRLQAAIKMYDLNPDRAADAGLHFARCKYKKQNCYTFFGYEGIFDIHDCQVPISLHATARERYNQLALPARYITINFGWGNNEHGEYKIPNKVWPFEYYKRFVWLFHRAVPGLAIVQLGMPYSKKISNVDRYVFGEKLEVLKFVLQGSLLHLDCESGLVHLATQLGTKCAVVFGPTLISMFGYPQNINIASDVCSECRALENDFSKCLHSNEDRVCMYSILPEQVMEKVGQYLCEQLRD